MTTIAIAKVGRVITLEKAIKKKEKKNIKSIGKKDKSDNFTGKNREKSNIANITFRKILIRIGP